MAKRTVNIGSTANDGTGDQLRTAFDKLNQNNDEIYGANFVTEDMLNDNIVGADELKVTGDGSVGQILTSNADGTFSWATGVAGDITGVEAGDGLTGGGTGGDVTLNVVAGTGITVTADEVALATTVQNEISANTAKDAFPGFGTAAGTSLEGDTALLQVGTLATEALAGNTTTITPAQAAEIADNTLKVSDQTVTLTEGANVTITGTYPSFTIASDDVVGAVTSVNGDVGVVVLDTDDVSQGTTNLYNVTHTGDVSDSSGVLTIADNVVNATKLDVTGNGSPGQLLQSDGDGSMTWVTGVTGDVTGVTAGDGLAGGGTSGDLTISLDTGVAGDGLTLTSGVLDVNVATSQIADDAVTADKLADSINTDIAAGVAKVSNVTHSGDVTDVSGVLTLVADKVITSTILDANVTTAKLANDAVDYDKLGTEFTTSATISALDVDFSSAAVFTKALSGTTTLTFSNVETGMVKTLVISGNQSLVLPSGVTILNGTYSGTATTNVIQIVSTNGSAQMFATVSNV